jgi:hypothetical protein
MTQTLEDYIKDFILSELDYFEINDDYWHLFNLCTKEQVKIVKDELEKIRISKEIISDIQKDCYYI